MLQTEIGALAATTPAKALAAYDAACAGQEGFSLDQAAHLLASVLRKPKRSAGLDAEIRVGRKAKHWGEFVIQWADGSDTLVRGVIYDRPQDRWAAAFQAADRLRRMRGRHAWEGEPGAPARWTQRHESMNGIIRQTAAYERYCRERPLPACVLILADDGEEYRP